MPGIADFSLLSLFFCSWSKCVTQLLFTYAHQSTVLIGATSDGVFHLSWPAMKMYSISTEALCHANKHSCKLGKKS